MRHRILVLTMLLACSLGYGKTTLPAHKQLESPIVYGQIRVAEYDSVYSMFPSYLLYNVYLDDVHVGVLISENPILRFPASSGGHVVKIISSTGLVVLQCRVDILETKTTTISLPLHSM